MADTKLRSVAVPAEDPSSRDEERQVALDRVLDLVDADLEPAVVPPSLAPLGAGMLAARVLEASSEKILLESWDGSARFVAQLAPFVDANLLEEARREGRVALVDSRPHGATLIGFLQTAAVTASGLRGRDVEIEATNELVLRSGRAALRLRADGTVELVGTRISAVSRGVLRLLGRALRLN